MVAVKSKSTPANIKPATTFQEQVDILGSRKLIITDRQFAENFLSSINYYRFFAYTLSLRDSSNNGCFLAETTFEQVVDIYKFDQAPRYILVEYLEQIEVSIRTHITSGQTHQF